MKKIVLLLTIVFCFIKLKASPQAPDYLIIGKDTLPVCQLILEEYLDSVEEPAENNSLFGFNFREGASPNCWRGYQAVYSLENDSLFLKYVLPCGSIKNFDSSDANSSNEQMKKIVTEKVKNDKVFMDWYSNELAIPKGKPVCWDGIFTTIYDKEKQKLENRSECDDE